MWPKRRTPIQLDAAAKQTLRGGVLARIERVYLAPPLAGTRTYPCPCCRYPTLSEPPPGTFDICTICGWEDDNVQFDDPTFRGGANVESLAEARAKFAALEARDPAHAHRRPPTPAEILGRAP
jgi:hypothetical protein